MWEKIRSTGIKLDKPKPFSGNVHLGCKQQDITTPRDVVQQKRAFYEDILNKELVDEDGTPIDNQNQKVVSHQMDLDRQNPKNPKKIRPRTRAHVELPRQTENDSGHNRIANSY